MAVKDGLPATDFSRMNREYIKAVAEGGSGGGGLPEITAADEGKFLGVVSGEAAWATAGGGGGGGGVLLITNNNGTLNKTAKEISDAFLAGTTCLVTETTTKSDYTITEYGIVSFYENVNHTELGTIYDFYVINAAEGSGSSDLYEAASMNDYPVAQPK